MIVRVKISGLLSAADMEMAADAGADALGVFVEHPVSAPWSLGRAASAELVRGAPPFLPTVAVMDDTERSMVAAAREVRPRYLQIDGSRTAEEVNRVRSELSEDGIGVIATVTVDADSGRAPVTGDDPVAAARVLAGTGVRALVIVLSGHPEGAETGVLPGSRAAERVKEAVGLPLILAGGLTAGNVPAAVTATGPYAVDVVTGVESGPGIKDPVLMRRFVAAAKGWDHLTAEDADY